MTPNFKKDYVCDIKLKNTRMSKEISIPDEIITSKIYQIREQKVMLDNDLAELYQVETRRLNEQVKRNADRFPEDFMFQLTEEEWENLKSQNATSSWGGRRKLPFAFTEHGVLMLSSVLNSKRAIAVNIHIMRVFNRIKEMLLTHKDLLLKMEEMEKRIGKQDEKITVIFDYLKQFINEQKDPPKQIGFKQKGK